METGELAMCALATATKWPHRIPDILDMLPERPAGSSVDRALWESLERCHSAGLPASVDDFHERLLFDIRMLCPDFEPRVRHYIGALRTRTDLSETYCIRLIRDHALRSACLELCGDFDEQRMAEIVDRFGRVRDVSQGGALAGVDLFADDGEDMLMPVPRVSVGCTVMDNLFLGLPPPGTLTLGVMPRKSGKTLLSIYLARCCVEHGLRVLYMNFEQYAKGDLARRVYSAMTGEPVSLFSTLRRLSDLPADVLARMRAAQDVWRGQFVMLDAASLHAPGLFANGVQDLETIIRHLFVPTCGGPPDVVIADWWGEWWNLLSSRMTGASRMTDNRKRQEEGFQFLRLKVMAGDMYSRFLVFHQMRHAISGTAFNIDKLSVNDAAENKALPAFADAGFVSTTKNTENLVTIRLDIDRNQESGAMDTYRLDGARQQFLRHDNVDDQRASAAADAAGEDPTDVA